MTDDRSDRARARQANFDRFMSSATIRPDNPETAFLDRLLAERYDTKEHRNERRRIREEALKIATAFIYNGPDFPTDRYLRNFLLEYNNRTFMTYGDQQPSSFSVMSDFIEPDEQVMVLRLVEEEIALFDLGEYLELQTSHSAVTGDLRQIGEFKAYQFNQVGPPALIQLPELDAFRFGGMGMVRNGSAVSAMAIFGEPAVADSYPGSEQEPVIEKDFLKDIEVDNTPEDFFGVPGYAPVILLMTVDAGTRAYASRFVLRETRTSFDVIYDDPYTHEQRRRLMPENFEEFSRRNHERMSTYDDLFQVVVSLFDLPEYFSRFEDDVRTERHPTRARLEKLSLRTQRLLNSAPRELCARYRNVSHLRRARPGGPSQRFSFDREGLHRETSGYWRPVELGAAGLDKNGQRVTGRTWVTKDLSWFETQEAADRDRLDVMVEGIPASEELGYLYVLRNPAHPRDTVKIGWTSREPEERAAELSATTGQPDVFLVVEAWKVRSPKFIEQRIHTALADSRLRHSREFFTGSYKALRKVILTHIEGYEVND